MSLNSAASFILFCVILTWFPICHSRSKTATNLADQKQNPTKTAAHDDVLLGNSPNKNSLLPEPRIVGGEEVVKREFPFMVALHSVQQEVVGKAQYLCGGTLLNDKWVLTAAHCVMNKKTDTSFQVYLGSNRLDKPKITRWVYYYKMHPHYNASFVKVGNHSLHEVDIALVRMNNKVVFDDDIQPAKLPLCRRPDYVNETVVAAGWGTTNPGTDDRYIGTSKLQKLAGVVVDTGFCKKFNRTVAICIDEPGKGVCHGDSGGPLVLPTTGEVIGIVSEGICTGGSLFTKIGPRLNWIEDVQFYATVTKYQYVRFNSASEAGISLSENVNRILTAVVYSAWYYFHE